MFGRKRTYKDIEESRNRRLWITEVILPIGTLAIVAMSNPEVKKTCKKMSDGIKNETNKVVNKVKGVFSKKGKEEES